MSRFKCLTGIRGLAILWVVFVHVPVSFGHVIDLCRDYFGLGVDLFLAVSGFLVTRSLMQSAQAPQYESLSLMKKRAAGAFDFLSRRVSRIFPSYFSYIALVFAIAFLVDRTLWERLQAVPNLIQSLLLFHANYTMADHFQNVPVIVNNIWSLALQEQFYLFLILSLLAFGVKRFHLFILSAAIFSLVARFYMVLVVWKGSDITHTPQIQFWTHLRLDALAWASLAWVYFDRLGQLWATPSRKRIADLGLLVGFILVFGSTLVLRGDLSQALIYTFKAPLLALFVRRACDLDLSHNRLPRLLQYKWLGRIGLSAYEIYLIHPLVIAVVIRLHLPAPLLFLTGMIGSVVVGWMAYEILGRPAQLLLRGLLLRAPHK